MWGFINKRVTYREVQFFIGDQVIDHESCSHRKIFKVCLTVCLNIIHESFKIEFLQKQINPSKAIPELGIRPTEDGNYL